MTKYLTNQHFLKRENWASIYHNYLYLGLDFDQKKFGKFLSCSSSDNLTCEDLSKSKDEICKPLFHASNLSNDTLLIVLLAAILFFAILIFVFDVIISVKSDTSYYNDTSNIALIIYICLISTIYLIFSRGNFETKLFCAINYDEQICNDQVKPLLYSGNFHSSENAILSSSCELQWKDDVFVRGSKISYKIRNFCRFRTLTFYETIKKRRSNLLPGQVFVISIFDFGQSILFGRYC